MEISNLYFPRELIYRILKYYNKFFLVCKDGHSIQEIITSNNRNILVTMNYFENLKQIIFPYCRSFIINIIGYKNDYLNSVRKITYLNLKNNADISDTFIENMVKLKKLKINGKHITNKGIMKLTKLEVLKIYYFDTKISSNGLKNLINLKKLIIGNKNINDSALINLVKLEYLHLFGTFDQCNVSNLCISKLINLKYLKINNKNKDFSKGLKYLTKLEYLEIHKYKGMHSFDILRLVNLTCLAVPEDTKISDSGIALLHNLKYLELPKNNKITDYGIRKLFRLEKLIISFNKNITVYGLSNFIKSKIQFISLFRNFDFYVKVRSLYPNVKYEYHMWQFREMEAD